jgi:chlorobactene glucosyltransferase
MLAETPPNLPRLSVIVPVRNEAINVERCLTALLAQDYPDLEIIVVDDDSRDGTADIVRRVAAGDPRVKVIAAQPLAPGWKGKPNACWCGTEEAHGEWLCFIDADTAPSVRGLLSSVVVQVQGAGLDMVSCQPFQELGTFWERIIYPTGFILLLLLLDIGRINDPAKPDAAANGQFLLIRREVYDAVGGHKNEIVRGQFVEDIALAQVVKKAGYRLSLMLADNGIRTRMYTGLRDMWNGFSRLVFDIFHGMAGSILAAIGALCIGCLPIVLLLVIGYSSAWPVLAALSPGLMAILALHVWIATYLALPAWYGLLFPLGYAMGAAILFNGMWQRMAKGVWWRGRKYDTG